MDGELLSWNGLYRLVMRLCTGRPDSPRRRGHPDEYSPAEVVLCWLWSGLVNLPLATAMRKLTKPRYRRGMRAHGYLVPPRCPHETTLRRRSRRLDFWIFLVSLHLALIAYLRPDTGTLLMDSSPLPVPRTSRDPDATWGHHNLYGYRWHTLTSLDRVILSWGVYGAHVQELAVAPILVRQAAPWGWRCRHLSADAGYDSEPLHRAVRNELGGMLVAPLNDRGGERVLTRTPLLARLDQGWANPHVQRARHRRGEIDRMYSVLKGYRFGLYALPPWVRGQPAVERWLMLKTLLYHAYLLFERRNR